MKRISKYKVDIGLLVILFCFITISLVSINSAQKLISNDNLVIKQLLWYIAGFIISYFIKTFGYFI